MQAEHHFGKPEPRVVERDAVVAGEREFEAAAEAIAVDDRNRRDASACPDGRPPHARA